MIKKFIEGTVLALALFLVAFMTFLAFSPMAHSADTPCVTASQMQEDYGTYKKNNPEDDKAHFYRFTGETLEAVKVFVNSNYEAGFNDSVKGLVLMYLKGNPTGIAAIFPDDTINSCATKMISPSVESIEKVIEFLEGV